MNTSVSVIKWVVMLPEDPMQIFSSRLCKETLE